MNLPALATGVYRVRATAYDKSGNSASAISEFAVDVTPPNLSVTTPIVNGVYNSLPSAFGTVSDVGQGLASDKAVVFSLYRNGATGITPGWYANGNFNTTQAQYEANPGLYEYEAPLTELANGSFRWERALPSPSIMTPGRYVLRVFASDEAGSETGPVDVPFTIDPNAQNIAKLQYRVPGDPAIPFVDVAGQTIYVPLDKSREFKAIPTKPSLPFLTGKPVWSGTSGASGTGVTKIVTFNTPSSSASDTKTVTAEAGNTQTENVLVFSVALSRSSQWSPENDVLETLPNGQQVPVRLQYTINVPQDRVDSADGKLKKSTPVEFQANIVPSGVRLPLSDFGFYQTYSSTLRAEYYQKEPDQYEPVYGSDGAFGPELMDRDGGAATYYVIDAPGPDIATWQSLFDSDPDLKTLSVRQSFEAHPTYKGNILQAPFYWNLTTRAVRRAPGSRILDWSSVLGQGR